MSGRRPRTQLLIALDAGYPEVIDECWTAMTLTMPGCRVARYKMAGECVRVAGASTRWLEAFPQHGPGRKHERPIVLDYPRYFFSNLSADIRGLFCEYCDALGIRWTQSNHRNISVSHRRSVAALDEFIGPKC